jgi:lipid kinase YegS
LVVNGKIAEDPELRDAVNRLRGAGESIEVRVTWERGDAARYAVEAVRDRVDVVGACGGDGTVSEVVQGVLESDEPQGAAIAVIPFGTANDFAHGCKIPMNDPQDALDLALGGSIQAIDVGMANERVFVNVASGGFGAEVTTSTPLEWKRAFGGAAYSLMGVVAAAKMSPQSVRVTFPDGTSSAGEMLVVTVANGRQCGGGHQVAPRAYLDDGLLDVAIVHDVDIKSFGKVFGELITLGDEANQYVTYRQLPWLKIESDRTLQVNLDGEPVKSNTFEFSIRHRAIRMVLPPGAPLVGT